MQVYKETLKNLRSHINGRGKSAKLLAKHIIRLMQQYKFEADVIDVLRKHIRPALSHFEARITSLEIENTKLREEVRELKDSKAERSEILTNDGNNILIT